MWELKGFVKGRTPSSFMVEAELPDDVPYDALLVFKISKYNEKRSLNANNYFHKLCSLLADKLGISMAECKNNLITSYGQIWYLDDNDEPWIYKTNAPPEFIREQEEIHLKLVKIDTDNVYFYRVYRGSHTYDTAEMAKLIDGTIKECEAQDIPTATQTELDKMYEEWGKIYEHK